MTTLKERLNAALAEKTFGSQSEMARECDVSTSAVSFWFNGQTKTLRGKNLTNAARYLGVEPSWLSSGTDLTPMRTAPAVAESGQYAKVPRLVVPTEETSQEAVAHDDAPPPIAFRRDWLRQKGLNPDNLRIHQARGSAMFPTLDNGDLLLLDTSKTTPENNEVWAIRGGEIPGIRIRRILINERQEWILRSDNPDKSLFEDERIRPAGIADIQKLGKIVWRGG